MGDPFHSAVVGAVRTGGVQVTRRWELVTCLVPFGDPLVRPWRCHVILSRRRRLFFWQHWGAQVGAVFGNHGACHPILPRFDFIVSSPHQPPSPSAGHGGLPPRWACHRHKAASSLARFQQYGYWHAKFQFQAIKQYN